MWKNILTRFQTPKTLIIDNELQFAKNPFRGWCQDKHIEQWFTLVAHPQENEQIEILNKTLVNGIKKCLGKPKHN